MPRQKPGLGAGVDSACPRLEDKRHSKTKERLCKSKRQTAEGNSQRLAAMATWEKANGTLEKWGQGGVLGAVLKGCVEDTPEDGG